MSCAPRKSFQIVLPVLVCLLLTSIDTPTQAESPLERWDFKALSSPPKMRWESQEGPIHSLIYTGEPYQGHETEVFAFYASPSTLGKANGQTKFPGVVLIHGGGGTAFAEWAWLWANRGYAAIAMDLSGRRPIAPQYDAAGVPVNGQASRPQTRTRLEKGGPEQGGAEKFQCMDADKTDDWPYHAVASCVRAHSLIRSFPEVDPSRTGVTGISWGGYTTCLVASVDSRFQAAVPVYGCGFLYEGESVQKPMIDALGDKREEWIAAYDPSKLLCHCQVPILFVNGTNDVHYPMDSYQKSFDVVPGPKQMRMEVKMPHSHPSGWAPQEIGLFIDSHCKNGAPLAQLGTPEVVDQAVHVPCSFTVPLKSAALHYTVDLGPRSKREWVTVAAEIKNGTIVAPRPPRDANTWFVTVVDERNAMSSTTIQFH